MGIPSYFSHIIKNHNAIVRKPDMKESIDNLYIDSNSIIYDVIHQENSNQLSFDEIFNQICLKLDMYIQQISPQKLVFIAFDGVAPVAKLSQQRTRRIKNTILKNMEMRIANSKLSNNWDSTQITPGTKFMISLNKFVQNYFTYNTRKIKIIISGSDHPGEGEHKLFEYIRTHDHIDSTTVVYGLDADLIMLSLLHTKYCNKVYLYRETPQFIKQLDSSLNPSELYLLSINFLRDRICMDMSNNAALEIQDKNSIMSDYVFICFMLGNDFIPHNPGVNIRTNGIGIIMDIYRQYFSNDKFIINKENQIHWKNFKKFCSYIANEEKNYFIHEHKLRDKLEKRKYSTNTVDEKKYKLNILPSINRETEHYINPINDGWQNRYYNTLFDVEYNDIRLKQISFNYLEALEWTWKYYSEKCYDWRWKYNYDYAPLFEDVIKYIPYYTHDFISFSTNPPINELTQLIYVLPEESHYLLPPNVKDILNIKYSRWFDKSSIEFKWDYCKYLWEAHLTLPEIDIEEIETNFKCYIKN
jgi:5'-3' exonuclease|uniref:Xrn1 N-terminal domain-containing protein n=1 Tax=viral metagenome TaxID=1070528 RepID=A0A6C0LJ87_9ZZZZ|tara:strand:- start:308 stop:1891 length:1584 start_codon:yes stop_codon:yes gene_type:complete